MIIYKDNFYVSRLFYVILNKQCSESFYIYLNRPYVFFLFCSSAIPSNATPTMARLLWLLSL